MRSEYEKMKMTEKIMMPFLYKNQQKQNFNAILANCIRFISYI